jgi:tetratricopeptide (TPR) repeat protein
MGVVYRKEQNSAKAREPFLADVAIEPDVAFNYNELGLVSWSLGQTTESEKYFREAIEHDPRLSVAHYGLAKVYKQAGRYKAALSEIEKAASLDYNSASVHFLHGQILAKLDQQKAAEKELQLAATIQKTFRDDLVRKVSGESVTDPQAGGEPK